MIFSQVYNPCHTQLTRAPEKTVLSQLNAGTPPRAISPTTKFTTLISQARASATRAAERPAGNQITSYIIIFYKSSDKNRFFGLVWDKTTRTRIAILYYQCARWAPWGYAHSLASLGLLQARFVRRIGGGGVTK